MVDLFNVFEKISFFVKHYAKNFVTCYIADYVLGIFFISKMKHEVFTLGFSFVG